MTKGCERVTMMMVTLLMMLGGLMQSSSVGCLPQHLSHLADYFPKDLSTGFIAGKKTFVMRAKGRAKVQLKLLTYEDDNTEEVTVNSTTLEAGGNHGDWTQSNDHVMSVTSRIKWECEECDATLTIIFQKANMFLRRKPNALMVLSRWGVFPDDGVVAGMYFLATRWGVRQLSEYKIQTLVKSAARLVKVLIKYEDFDWYPDLINPLLHLKN